MLRNSKEAAHHILKPVYFEVNNCRPFSLQSPVASNKRQKVKNNTISVYQVPTFYEIQTELQFTQRWLSAQAIST
jgi:hypothetical protein